MGLSWEDDCVSITFGKQTFALIQLQLRLAIRFISTMALEATIGQDRPYVALKLDYLTTAACRSTHKCDCPERVTRKLRHGIRLAVDS